VFLRPGALFARLEVENRAAGALLVLLLFHVLGAALLLTTGVPDYEIAARAQRDLARAAEQLRDDETSNEFTQAVESLEKQATFNKLFSRLQLQVGGPLRLLAGVALVASALYLVVAVWGRTKADYPLLAALVIFASYTALPRLAARLFLVSQLQVLRVETSAAAFLTDPRAAGLVPYLLLRRLDPFELWYWALVGLGLWKTGQFTGKRAVVATVLLALLTAAGQSVLDLSEVAEIQIQLSGQAA
jgi:hypothetical protein